MKGQRWMLMGAVLLGHSLFAGPITYFASLSGANENPANASPATGLALVTIDTTAHTLEFDVTFSGLTANATAAHIHCCVAPPGSVGVATQTPSLTGFPAATSGTYLNTFDTTLTSTFSSSFVTANGNTAAGAEAALAAGLAAGRAYFNIHTSQFPGGEIRGFLTPEPETLTLAGGALAALVLARFRRRARRL